MIEYIQREEDGETVRCDSKANEAAAEPPLDCRVGLLTEAADELAWLHREYMSRTPLSEGVPRITRLLQKIEAHTGHVTASPYPPPNAEVTSRPPTGD